MDAVVIAFVAGVLVSVLGAEGVDDALVGGVGLPLDAVGVDLEQDGDDSEWVALAFEEISGSPRNRGSARNSTGSSPRSPHWPCHG